MAEREQEMEKFDSEQNKEMKKVKLKLEVCQKQGSTSMNSVGTKGGKITKISDLTGQSLAGVTTAELTSFGIRVERKEMKDLVAAVESILNMCIVEKTYFQKKQVSLQ